MEMAGKALCERFETNMLSQCHCQNCFHPEEVHRARHQEPGSPPSAEPPYCDLPRCPPAPEDTLSTETSTFQPVVGPGLRQGSERVLSSIAGLSDQGPTAVPRSGHGGLEAVLNLESPASSLCDSCDKSPNSDTSSGPDSDIPDDTSNSSSVDWHAVERRDKVPNQDELTMMIPRRAQEGPRTDSAQRVTKSPVRRDSEGQRKEDKGSRSRSTGQHWAKPQGESGYFSLEQHRSSPTQASSETPQSGPRSATCQASSAQRDIAQALSIQEPPRASSAHRITQRDNPRTLSTQRDSPRASSTQQNTLRTSSPSRVSHHPSTSAPRRNNPQRSSPLRPTQQDSQRTTSTQQVNLPNSFPTCPPQRENPRTSCTQKDNARVTSPNRTTQWEIPKASCAQRDSSRASSPNRAPQREKSRTSCAQQDNPRASSPTRTSQRENSRTSCAQRDKPRSSSPSRTPQKETLRTSCIQQNTPKTSSTHRDNPKPSCSRWEHLRSACTQRDAPHCSSSQRDGPGTSSPQRCTQRDHPGLPSPRHATPRSNLRNSSPHRTNKDIPWASFPLRPTPSDAARTSSPSRPKQSEVPWASIALRPTQGDRPWTSSPTRSAQRDTPKSSWGLGQHNAPPQAASSSCNPGHLSASRTSSPLHPATRGPPQTSSEPSQPPYAVCIGHRDAPRASSPPRCLQHDPFPFFPEPQAPESESPHHDPPYMPPAVCIGHRDAPRASSPPRHTQFDPFPFLPDTSDAENETENEPPQHEPPHLPPPVCIGYRDAPRASSPPRQFPEPPFLFQDLPGASTDSLVPPMDSLHEPPHIPTPVCIGHRDAPSFSSPPRQAPEPSLFFQDRPGASMESLAPSTDSLHGCPLLPPQVCIGHRDAPRASSPPRHPPSDLALLAPSPPPGSSRGSRGSAPPGETRHNLEREEYTVLADLPRPRRLAQREPAPQAQGSIGGRTRSPGRTEVERLFGQERRKSETPGAFQAQDERRSPRPSRGQSQPLRRQPSPAAGRQVTKAPAKQAEPARRSPAEPARSRSLQRQPEGDRRQQRSSPPPRTSARPPERELWTEKALVRGRGSSRQPLPGWQSQEELPGSRVPHSHLERSWSSQEEGPGPGGWPGLGKPSLGAARALEGAWQGLLREYRESWGQSEAWEGPPSNGLQERPQKPAPRGWGSLQELSFPPQAGSPPEHSWVGQAESSHPQRPETPTAMGSGPERPPELDWRDLLGLFRAPGEGAWARLPRLDWEGLLELLQARLPHKDPAGHWGDPASGPQLGPPGTQDDALEQEQHSRPGGWAEAIVANGHHPGQQPQSAAQPPIAACTSTQWPKTQETSGPVTSSLPGLQPTARLEQSRPAQGPSLLEPEFQPEEPQASEPSRGQDSLTEQEQADSVVGSWAWAHREGMERGIRLEVGKVPLWSPAD